MNLVIERAVETAVGKQLTDNAIKLIAHDSLVHLDRLMRMLPEATQEFDRGDCGKVYRHEAMPASAMVDTWATTRVPSRTQKTVVDIRNQSSPKSIAGTVDSTTSFQPSRASRRSSARHSDALLHRASGDDMLRSRRLTSLEAHYRSVYETVDKTNRGWISIDELHTFLGIQAVEFRQSKPALVTSLTEFGMTVSNPNNPNSVKLKKTDFVEFLLAQVRLPDLACLRVSGSACRTACRR